MKNTLTIEQLRHIKQAHQYLDEIMSLLKASESRMLQVRQKKAA